MKSIEEKALEAQEHFQKLLMFVQNTADKDAHYMENEIFNRLLKLGNNLMRIYIDSVGTGYCGKHVHADNGLRFKHEGSRQIIHTTIFGEIPIEREYYRNVMTSGVFPLDDELNLPERTYSYLVERISLGVALHDSYEEARKYTQELFGISLPTSSLQKLSKKSSAYFEEYYREKELEPIRNGELTVVLADGKGIPMKTDVPQERKKRLGRGEKNGHKKMALVGTVYNVEPQFEPEKKDSRPKNKKIWAFLEEKERTMQLLQHDVVTRLDTSQRAGDIVFIADGARGLWSLKEKYFPTAVGVLDWYHMSEYLWKAVYVFYPEGSKEAIDWIQAMEEKIFYGKVSQVITGLKVRIAKNGIKGERLKVLQSVIEYFKNNKDRMNYSEYREKGYPIGSGNVESACRYLIKDRMEKTGMRWKYSGAQAILSLRATYLNGDLNDYWEYYMGKEKNRLYGRLNKCA